MNEGQQGAIGAIPQGATGAIPGAERAASQANAGQATAEPKRKRRELAEAYQVGPENWSARARRDGCDIFVSGFKTQGAAEKELRYCIAVR